MPSRPSALRAAFASTLPRAGVHGVPSRARRRKPRAFGQVIVAEEAAKCRMGAYVPACGAFGIDPPSVIWLGTEAQREPYGVQGIERGKKNFVAISEASGGSDPARKIQTRAVRDGDHYVLNGAKLWITGAETADWGIVFARTGEKGSGTGISAFIVDRETAGIETREIPVIRSYAPYEVSFKDVRVPVDALPSGPNRCVGPSWWSRRSRPGTRNGPGP